MISNGEMNGSMGLVENFFDDLKYRSNHPDNNNGELNVSEKQQCFHYFDKDRDGILNHQEFHDLCCQLLPTHADQQWTNQDSDKVMKTFSKRRSVIILMQVVTTGWLSFSLHTEITNTWRGQGQIDEDNFPHVWKNWIEPIVKPKSAFLVVDVQNDFISGTLALRNGTAKQNGEEVVPVINRLTKTAQFDEVIFSYDWHPDDHISFFENRRTRAFHSSSPATLGKAKLFDTVIFAGLLRNWKPIEQTLWPALCIQHSYGAELHEDLHVEDTHTKAYKGTNPEQECYSVFYSTPEPNNTTSGHSLANKLKSRGITDVYVCGLATDICVAYTVLDACELGFRTILVEDACRGLANESIAKMKRKMETAGCVVVSSDEVSNMVSGLVRHPKLADVTASNIKT